LPQSGGAAGAHFAMDDDFIGRIEFAHARGKFA